jgi:hypothetical protein
LASLELRAGADEGDQMWRVDRSPAGLADSISLNASRHRRPVRRTLGDSAQYSDHLMSLPPGPPTVPVRPLLGRHCRVSLAIGVHGVATHHHTAADTPPQRSPFADKHRQLG